MINFVHLFPRQLGMNGERGNLDCLQSRLRWAGLDSLVHDVGAGDDIPESVDAVFIGSGTLSGALEALELMRPLKQRLTELASSGFPFLS
jgi:CobQ-like glutamine amidotransferase family enzyme